MQQKNIKHKKDNRNNAQIHVLFALFVVIFFDKICNRVANKIYIIIFNNIFVISLFTLILR